MAYTSSSKQAVVNGLIRKLQDDISVQNLSNTQRREILEKLKVHGRDTAGADAIYCTSGVKVLCYYAFTNTDHDVYREALRCIANALLLKPPLRATFTELGHATSTAKAYQRQEDDDEFLAARILFLLTYGTRADFPTLIESYHLIESIQQHLARHATSITQGPSAEPMATMSWSETLKLIYNIISFYDTERESLSVTVPSIWVIFSHVDIPARPLDLPVNTIINALATLSLEATSTPSATTEANRQYSGVLPKLIKIVQSSLGSYTPSQLETQIIPLMTVLRTIYSVSTSDVKSAMQQALLPSDSERDLPLGKSSSLASQLLQLTISPGLINLPEAISSLMFEMSDKDASVFVRNIGYGYAAGYLMTHKIPIPENAKQIKTGSEPGQIPINPVTGQRLDKETVPDLPEMTPEEKEREAERLFVLFERLKATGVVDVQNPVEQAVKEGLFEKDN